MSLKSLLGDGRLRRHTTSATEIADLLKMVDRDLRDTGIEDLSVDRRFTIAYNAVLQLATVVLRASGYRTSGAAHHWATFQVLPDLMGHAERDRADYLNACRRKRNTAVYDAAGVVSDAELRELLAEAESFRQDVLGWLGREHPDLLTGGK